MTEHMKLNFYGRDIDGLKAAKRLISEVRAEYKGVTGDFARGYRAGLTDLAKLIDQAIKDAK